MKHKLEDYEAKRRFETTPEPPGRAKPRKTQGGRAGKAASGRSGAASFVIQRHDARQLHYDFRLELDGTLKSWAVPKGPSLDPSVKRLAVHVEDHPLAYGSFEGRIPEGNYGAGTVEIWDRGTWRPEGGLRAARDGYEHGKLNFSLDGQKLHGNWTLVRRPSGNAKQDQWLLIKRRDDEAVSEAEFSITADGQSKKASKPDARSRATKPGARAALPAELAPQLATPADAPPNGDDWLYELKFDGYRVLARIEQDAHGKPDVRVFTRAGLDWTAKFPKQVEALHALDLQSAWLDGEAMVLDEHGVPNFQALQNAFEAGRADAIEFRFFDVPWLNGADLRKEPLETRRAQLAALLNDAAQPALRFSEAFEGDPQSLLQAACEANLEGLVAKRRDSPYTSTRSAAWLKLRCSRRQEFVIGGYSEPSGSRVGFGALLIGVYEDGALRYAGRVGTGFDTRILESLTRELQAHSSKTSPFAGVPPAERRATVHWVRPELVAEVRFKTWTSAGVVRQASFVGLRRDKPPESIVREPQSQPVKAASASRRGASKADAPALASSSSARGGRHATRDETEVAGVRITHPERVIDAQSGLRKIDLVRYFEAISPWLLPHLHKRPVAIVRAPKGVGGEQFFQKHATSMQIPHATQHADLDPGHAPLLTLDTAQALVGAAQMDAVELHTWNALTTAMERPDRIVFDLDPDPALDWSRMIEAARLTHELLEELGLRAWCKTSGGKGLHVVVPLSRHSGWDEAREFARAVADHMAAMLPDRFSAKMGEANRKKRIFVDYLRNSRGASTIAAYAPRARPGLGVSVPLRWDELDATTGGAQWTVANLHERLDALEGDPWEGYANARQRLGAAMLRRLRGS
ncbi:DNA ligase D [Paraburkholderia sacchari]|uniref:DNA ligase D n=1 Tax=Paraburkholderia sacchari TaxID=159450 RepID=UPI000543B6E8|nr:DNA ligase D [Paraburkholderia sacchari]NLP60257.1 DNA ligase D [Paraburkholderia sacchari]